MEILQTILLITANISLVGVAVLYFLQVVKGDSTPNPVTWAIWFAVAVLNCITYFQLSAGVLKALISLSMTLFMLLMIIYSLFKGKFTTLKKLEKIIGVITALIALIWYFSDNIVISSLLIQFVLLISFIPTGYGLIKKQAREKTPAWLLATIAYSLQIIALLIDFDGNWSTLAFPLLNGVVGNGSILIIILIQKKI